MIKNLLLLFFLPMVMASAAPKKAVPFFLGGWETVFKKQFETNLHENSDHAEIDIHSFWKAYEPKKIKSEAVAFLKQSKKSGDFDLIDPDRYEISITAIRMEGLPDFPIEDFKDWYVVVELSAWGKAQRTGLPLWFQLVLIPGRGFKTPTLMKEISEEPNQAPEPTAPSGRGSS